MLLVRSFVCSFNRSLSCETIFKDTTETDCHCHHSCCYCCRWSLLLLINVSMPENICSTKIRFFPRKKWLDNANRDTTTTTLNVLSVRGSLLRKSKRRRSVKGCPCLIFNSKPVSARLIIRNFVRPIAGLKVTS